MTSKSTVKEKDSAAKSAQNTKAKSKAINSPKKQNTPNSSERNLKTTESVA
jgi:hypothetical protein